MCVSVGGGGHITVRVKVIHMHSHSQHMWNQDLAKELCIDTSAVPLAATYIYIYMYKPLYIIEACFFVICTLSLYLLYSQ